MTTYSQCATNMQNAEKSVSLDTAFSAVFSSHYNDKIQHTLRNHRVSEYGPARIIRVDVPLKHNWLVNHYGGNNVCNVMQSFVNAKFGTNYDYATFLRSDMVFWNKYTCVLKDDAMR